MPWSKPEPPPTVGQRVGKALMGVLETLGDALAINERIKVVATLEKQGYKVQSQTTGKVEMTNGLVDITVRNR